MVLTDSFPNNNITFEWCNSVKQIHVSEWETIFGKRDIKSHNLFLAMEEANFTDVDYYYLKIYNRGKIASITPCLDYKLDIIDLLANKKLRDLLNKMRKVSPNFLKLKTFVVGSYAATCEGFVEILSDKEEDYREIQKIINRELKKKGKETKSKFIFIKDVREVEIEKVKNILNEDFHFFVSFPTTLIPVGGKCTPYPAGLRSKYKQRCRHAKKLFELDFHWEVINDFSQHTKLLEELYLNVLHKAKNRFEVLNASFFANINNRFPEQSFSMIAKNKNGQVRVMTVVLEEEDRLLPLYLGIEYMNDDARILYLNTIYKTIEIAEAKGKEFVELGQTSYDPKVRSGAFLDNVYYGFSSSGLFRRLLIKHVFKYLFAPPVISTHAYTKEARNEAIEKFRSNGFRI